MRKVRAASIIVVVLVCFVAACTNMFSPASQVKCPGSLYCQSTAVPQNVSGGTCCVGPNASVGYLCAYGANRQPAGCTATSQEAWNVCTNATTVVRCVAE
jgi:hypothetical protein